MSSANDKSPGDEEAPRSVLAVCALHACTILFPVVNFSSRLRSRLSRLRKEGDTGKETELAPSGDKGGAGEDGAMPGADAGSAGESSRARGQNGEMGAAAHDPQEEKADIADGDPPPKGRLLLRARAGDAAADEMESGGAVRQEPQEPRGKVAILAPLSVLEPHRTDPMQNLRQRHKKMERVVATNLPEIHFAGQLVSGRGLIQDSTEGCCCR